MRYVGLDAHWRTSTVCILNENGQQVKSQTLRVGWEKLLEWLEANVERPFAICYEASCGYGYLHDRLREVAQRVVVAHPGQLRLIFRSKRKSDRVDAGKLAKLLFLNEVPPVYVPKVEVRTWRQLIEMRRREVDKRTRTKNALRALLRSHGLRPERRLWTKAGLAWARQVAMPTATAGLQRELLLEELEEFNGRIRRVTRALTRYAAREGAVAVLRTIPGVGWRTAEAVAAYVDDVSRFAGGRQVGSYFGLVPCQDQSAEARRLGHITRQGPATVRRMLTEATWQALRRSATVRRHFEQVRRGKAERKKIALVATSRWLLGCMAAMLRTGESWRESAEAQAPAAPAGVRAAVA